jgi:hypothetical protein
MIQLNKVIINEFMETITRHYSYLIAQAINLLIQILKENVFITQPIKETII